jgi:hypothetical protein
MSSGSTRPNVAGRSRYSPDLLCQCLGAVPRPGAPHLLSLGIVGHSERLNDRKPCFFPLVVGLVSANKDCELAAKHRRNMTTLEMMHHSSTDHYPVRARRGRRIPRHERSKLLSELRSINPYDLGWQDNIRSVFGRRSRFLAGWPTIRAYQR